jgi:hypothetical protein
MESQIKSSFIPQDVAREPRARAIRSGGFDLVVLVSIILLVASIALAIGVFLYVEYLQTSLTSKTEQLERAQATFEPALVSELMRLDTRMNVGGELLYNHIAPSEFFRILEEITLESVSFSNLQFDATIPSAISMSLDGVAASVNSIALQADLFGKHAAIASPIFSNITREQGDRVRFSVTALVNPTAIRYSSVVQTQAAGGNAFDQTGQITVPAGEAVVEEEEGIVPVFVP